MDAVARRLLVAAVLLLAAGCGTGSPQVTFAAGGTTVTARAAPYCDLKLADCTADADAPVRLAVPPGTPLQVTVPDDVSAAPWHVVFSYRDVTGQQIDARSPVLAKKEHGYTLTLPEAADRLITAQVQQFGPAPRIDEQTGEVEFPVRGSWIVTTGVR